MTPEQRSLLLAYCAAEMRGDRYIPLRVICETQKTIASARIIRLIEGFESLDKQKANELLRKMDK